MFMELGMKLDNLIERIRIWNTQRFWCKIYGHFYIRRKIKAKAFKDYNSFKYFIKTARANNQIWDWQYKKFRKMFLEVYKEGSKHD